MGSSCAKRHSLSPSAEVTTTEDEWASLVRRLCELRNTRVKWCAIGLALKRNKGIRDLPYQKQQWSEDGRRLNRHKGLFRCNASAEETSLGEHVPISQAELLRTRSFGMVMTRMTYD